MIMKEIIAVRSNGTIIANIVAAILFAIITVLAILMIVLLDSYIYYIFVGILGIAGVVLTIYHLKKMVLCPKERIYYIDDSIIINERKAQKTIKISDITDISCKHYFSRLRTSSNGDLVLFFNNEQLEVKYLKNIEETKSRILKLMLESKSLNN